MYDFMDNLYQKPIVGFLCLTYYVSKFFLMHLHYKLNVKLYLVDHNILYIFLWNIYRNYYLLDYLQMRSPNYTRHHRSIITEIECYLICSYLQYNLHYVIYRLYLRLIVRFFQTSYHISTRQCGEFISDIQCYFICSFLQYLIHGFMESLCLALIVRFLKDELSYL